MDISVPKGKASMLCSYLEKFEGYAPEVAGPCETQRTAYHQLLKRQRLASVTRLRNRQGRGIDVLESATTVRQTGLMSISVSANRLFFVELHRTSVRLSLNSGRKCHLSGSYYLLLPLVHAPPSNDPKSRFSTEERRAGRREVRRKR